jgi:alanine racemase
MLSVIRARIDTGALRHNLATIRARAPHSRVIAVVKANGYGHGLVTVALALDGSTDAFGVARIEEGLQLRAAGISRPIVLLEGVFDAAQLAEAAQARLELVVHDPCQVALLESWRGRHAFTLWLKVDTGMNRLGFRVDQAAAAFARLAALAVPAADVRLLTHLARADEPDEPMTLEQVARFAALRAVLSRGALPPSTSIGNSAGTLAWPEARGDWVRPGLALYGVSPFRGQRGTGLGLRAAMSFESTVIGTRRVLRGESVGYGAAWRASRDSTIAIVAAGYGDGVPRNLASGAAIRVAGHRAELAGRVSMDMLAVDVTDLPPVGIGEPAVLWGPDLPVEDMAERAGTIPYELLCGLRARVPRDVL